MVNAIFKTTSVFEFSFKMQGYYNLEGISKTFRSDSFLYSKEKTVFVYNIELEENLLFHLN